MTIAERLAAKGNAAAPAQPGAAAPAAKKPFPSGLKIGPDPIEPTAEILPRSLSSTSGEDVPRAPVKASPQELVWHSALQALNTELCVIPDPDPRHERMWIAIRRPSEPERPLFLFSLPTFPGPTTPTEPF